jgi:hypothetical protein
VEVSSKQQLLSCTKEARVSREKEQWTKAVEEYLTTAEWCVDPSQHGGSIMGFSATLLLRCAVDAMGHGLLAPINGKLTRLDVLLRPPFDLFLNLDDTKVSNLTVWYRHMLAHAGTMAPGAFLEPHTQGKPIDFNQDGQPHLIRVPVLCEVVKSAWARRDPSTFYQPSMNRAPPNAAAQPAGFARTLTQASSGFG